jgi:hypothetical protein
MEKTAFSNCFNLFAGNSCSRRFFVIAIAREFLKCLREPAPLSSAGLGERWEEMVAGG